MWIAAGILSILFLIYPETVLNASLSAIHAWYSSVAPALFPFMALMPLLTCPAAAYAYERLLGRFMRPLFNLPGAAAPAIVIALVAGSPAGAIAASRIARTAPLSRSVLRRLLLCTCGLSPGFLITGIGVGMLNNPSVGHMLFQTQLVLQLLMLLLTRHLSSPEEILTELSQPAQNDGVTAAVTAILSVCGYMVLFTCISAVLARIFRSKIAEIILLCFMDVTSGARAITLIPMPDTVKWLLLAAVTGFGGLCIAAQNLSACRDAGLSPVKYVILRLCAAALSAGVMVGRYLLSSPNTASCPDFLTISALIASFLAIPAWISLMNKQLLNKRKFRKNHANIGK